MKRRGNLVIYLTALFVIVTSCTPKAVEVSSVSLNTSTVELVEGDTYSLVATVLPNNAEYDGISWASSNTSVASVNQGTVTALKEGKTTITASAGGKSATCSVTVSAKNIAVTSITLDKSELSLKVGSSDVITATVKPDDASDKSVQWSSSDATVVNVDNGKVTALKSGTATITATAGSCSAKCVITVPVETESITLDKAELSIAIGETATLTATITPADATDKTVIWTSSNTDVATVDDGTVKALKAGTTTITAQCSGKKAECKVTVTVPVTGITLDKTDLSIEVGKTATLTATVTPADATDKTISWTSSDVSIAIVKEGTITALKGGTATITAECSGKKAECKVTVTVPVSEISLDKTELVVEEGKTATLTATITPSDATDKSITWTSSNNGICTVSNGTITAVKEGKATITASAGGKSATCSVTVSAKYIAVTSITLDKTALSIAVGESATLKATITPSDATDQTVSWSSSNEGIVKVSGGTINAIQAGTATVSAKINGLSAECDVTVVSLDNIIYYTSYYHREGDIFTNVCNPYNSNAFGANIVSNEYADGLGKIVFDGPVTKIGDYAFMDSAIMTIDIPNTVTEIGIEAFYSSSLNSIDLPESVTSIKSSAFSCCFKLTSINIPKNLKTIGYKAFYRADELKNIKLNSGLKTIGNLAFSLSGLTEVIIPGSVITNQQQNYMSFYYCLSLKIVEFEEGFERVCLSCFDNCPLLTDVVFPSTLQYFNAAFSGCSNLSNVYIKSCTPPKEGLSKTNIKSWFSSSPNVTIWVPMSAVETYKNDEEWGYWADRIKGYDFD